jgi:hypothetical protein
MGGEMAQTMYAHVNKQIKKKFQSFEVFQISEFWIRIIQPMKTERD